MELLESQDPERKKLIETSDRHRRELENEIKEISVKTEKALTNALIIGGSLALTYFIVSRLTSNSKKAKKKKTRPKIDGQAEEEESEEPSMISQLGSKLVDQATLMLLSLAKEKLSEYLETKQRADT